MLSNILGKTGKGKSTIVENKRCYQINVNKHIIPISTIVEIKRCFQIFEHVRATFLIYNSRN